ncbi:MAG: endo-1,4-beta-xylanase [Marinilabiliaceae bacterium]|nr:endo-1,4-beta-xylanase [Marinilabiliaceae bacterium]
MKLNRILPALAMGSLLVASCDESKMEWETRDPASQITTAEIPLAMAEKISRYKALNEYAEMKLGIGIDLTLYMEDEVYANIVNENFDEITIGYHMKHGPMVTSKGDINFNSVDEMIAKLKENGLGVYGHTLVWHQNQNASYLNGLIAPTIIPGPAGSNLLENGDFDGNITGWGSWGGAKEVVEYSTEEKVSGTGSLKAVTKANAVNLWDLEIECSSVPVIEGHRYQITFFIKSDKAGNVRLAFKKMNQEYPSINGKETVATNSAWQQVTYDATTLEKDLMPAAGETTMQFRFDVGKDPSVTYYIDNVVMVDLDAAPTVVNMLANGTFETDMTGWSAKNGGPESFVRSESPDVFNGTGAMKVISAAAKDYWSVQIYSAFTETLAAGDYKLSFWIKSEGEGLMRCSTTGTAKYQGDQTTNATWKQVEWTFTSDGNITGLNFDMGKTIATYYIDDIVVSPVAAAASPKLKAATANTIIEKTAEEKTQLIGAAMESWIKGMMEHYKGDVKAWDVVNEPIGDNAELRDGNVSEPASDEFYWVKYLGKDYAVTAFKLARQYGNADDVLFINDYNLEHNIDKCKALIEYVTYIEEKGAKVDGIGTQMHININTNKENIKEMFTLLAATGKQVRITELDVQVQTDAPSADHYQKQAEMYQFVVDQYKALVPAAQQFGITVWGVSDNEKEHEHWIPDDAPNLWDAKYERKMAYKYFADGLAGKDVSADFSGELEYDE